MRLLIFIILVIFVELSTAQNAGLFGGQASAEGLLATNVVTFNSHKAGSGFTVIGGLLPYEIESTISASVQLALTGTLSTTCTASGAYGYVEIYKPSTNSVLAQFKTTSTTAVPVNLIPTDTVSSGTTYEVRVGTYGNNPCSVLAGSLYVAIIVTPLPGVSPAYASLWSGSAAAYASESEQVVFNNGESYITSGGSVLACSNDPYEFCDINIIHSGIDIVTLSGTLDTNCYGPGIYAQVQVYHVSTGAVALSFTAQSADYQFQVQVADHLNKPDEYAVSLTNVGWCAATTLTNVQLTVDQIIIV